MAKQYIKSDFEGYTIQLNYETPLSKDIVVEIWGKLSLEPSEFDAFKKDFDELMGRYKAA